MILKGYLAHKYMALDLLCFSLHLDISNILQHWNISKPVYLSHISEGFDDL